MELAKIHKNPQLAKQELFLKKDNTPQSKGRKSEKNGMFFFTFAFFCTFAA